MSENLAVIDAAELSQVDGNSLSVKQLDFLLTKTPAKYVKSRPGKGGGQWKFVSGNYVRKTLNLMFGWDWDFEILSEQVLEGEVIVKGRLTCRVNGRSITKTQFGNKEVVTKKTGGALSIGNDFKAAATDALKKCAFDLGIANDVYNPDEFKAVNVQEITIEDVESLFLEVGEQLAPEDEISIKRIIDRKEIASYGKAVRVLNKLK